MLAYDAVKAAGGDVRVVVCVVDRGEGGGEEFAKRGVPLPARFSTSGNSCPRYQPFARLPERFARIPAQCPEGVSVPAPPAPVAPDGGGSSGWGWRLRKAAPPVPALCCCPSGPVGSSYFVESDAVESAAQNGWMTGQHLARLGLPYERGLHNVRAFRPRAIPGVGVDPDVDDVLGRLEIAEAAGLEARSCMKRAQIGTAACVPVRPIRRCRSHPTQTPVGEVAA